jgi:prepilin-type N-terminal cleavage/methylation domain-containing protein
MTLKRKKDEAGFTLIELIMVIVILGITFYINSIIKLCAKAI